MRYSLILSLLFIGCTPVKKYTVSNHQVPVKYCKLACVEKAFKMFHNNGKSWGTSSSTMNGLGQQDIYHNVIRDCNTFYKDEKCCKRPFNDYNYHVVVSHIHGFEYGACIK